MKRMARFDGHIKGHTMPGGDVSARIHPIEENMKKKSKKPVKKKGY